MEKSREQRTAASVGPQPIPAEALTAVSDDLPESRQDEEDEDTGDDEEIEEERKPATKRPVGRPRNSKEITDAANAIRKARELPPLPGAKPTLKQLLEWMDLLTEDMWSHLICYVYRLKPNIIRGAIDPKQSKYIDKIGEKFSEVDIVTRHGGGRYKLVLNDVDRQKNPTICEVQFDVDMNQHEPKINYEELDVNAKANLSYVQALQRRGILDDSGKVLMKENGQPVGGGTDTSIVKELLGMVRQLTNEQRNAIRNSNDPEATALKSVIEMMSQGSQRAIDMAMAQVKSDDPSKTIALIESIMKLTGAGQNKDGGKEGFLERLLTLQQSAHDKQMDLLTKLMEARNPPREDGDEFSKLERFMSVAEKMGLKFKGGGSGWVDRIVDVAAPVLQNVTSILASQMMVKNANSRFSYPPDSGNFAGGGNPATVPPNTQQIPQINPSATYEETQAMNQATNATAPGNDASNKESQASQFIAQYGGVILNAISQEKTGVEFADDVQSMFGMQTYAMIASMGFDALIGGAKSVPEFWTQATAMSGGEDDLKAWIQDFIDYPRKIKAMHESEEDDEEENKLGA